MNELSPQAEANDVGLATTKELGILGPADRHSEAPEGPWESVFFPGEYGLPRRACGPPRNDKERTGAPP